MKLLIRASTYDEWVEPRAEFAIIHITPKMAKYYVALIDTAKLLKELYERLYGIEVFDDAPTWYDAGDERIDDFFDSGETFDDELVLIEALEKDEAVRIETVTVIAQPDSIIWSGYVRHTNVHVETWPIQAFVLEQIVKGE